MKNEINSLDAPKGYKAIKPIHCCIGCAFESSTQCGLERNCTGGGERKDKQMVIFVKK